MAGLHIGEIVDVAPRDHPGKRGCQRGIRQTVARGLQLGLEAAQGGFGGLDIFGPPTGLTDHQLFLLCAQIGLGHAQGCVVLFLPGCGNDTALDQLTRPLCLFAGLIDLRLRGFDSRLKRENLFGSCPRSQRVKLRNCLIALAFQQSHLLSEIARVDLCNQIARDHVRGTAYRQFDDAAADPERQFNLGRGQHNRRIAAPDLGFAFDDKGDLGGANRFLRRGHSRNGCRQHNAAHRLLQYFHRAELPFIWRKYNLDAGRNDVNASDHNMTTAMQVMTGSALLIFCALLHVAIVAGSIPFVRSLAQKLVDKGPLMRTSVLLSFGVMVILAAHTVQVWTWAFVFLASPAFNDFDTSFYFSMVTYTTLGYGDLVLGEGLRIFGTFASITGLLTFGISTAFLISLLTALFPSLTERD